MRRNFCLIVLSVFYITHAQIDVISESNKDSKTIVEIIVDSTSVDRNLNIDLKHYIVHGTAYAYNASITYYSNNKVAELPATLSLPNGRYSFNLSNGYRYGNSNFYVDASGGYQKWKVNPGDHLKAISSYRKSTIPFWSGIVIGSTLAIIGRIGKNRASIDMETAESDLTWADTREETRTAQTALDKATKIYNSKRALLLSGLSTMGLGFAVSVPLMFRAKKYGMTVEKIESKESAPLNLLKSQGLEQ